MTKKVVIISYSFPPNNAPAAQRPYYFAKYLPLHNIEVTIITEANSIGSLGNSNWADTSNMHIIKTGIANNLVENNSGSIGVVVKKSILYKIFNQLMIPDRGLIWLPKAIYYGLKNRNIFKDADYIFSTSPSFINHLIALIFSVLYNKKMLIDVRDYYYCHGRQHTRVFPLKYLDLFFEKIVFKRASKIIFISGSMKQEYIQRYPKHANKAAVIFNGFDISEFENLDITNDFKSQKIKIFYAGSFYSGIRSPFPLLQLLDSLIKSNYFSISDFEISIAGSIEAELIAEINEKTLIGKSIQYLGKISRKDALEKMSNADYLWLIIGNEISHYSGVPVKAFEYIASENRILNFAPACSEVEKIIDDLGCGITLLHNTSDNEQNKVKLIKEFTAFKNGAYKNYRLDKNKILEFTRPYQSEQLAQIINKEEGF
jgi:glycosyltransferase involved in cell wall biosynthesis